MKLSDIHVDKLYVYKCTSKGDDCVIRVLKFCGNGDSIKGIVIEKGSSFFLVGDVFDFYPQELELHTYNIYDELERLLLS